MEENAGFFINLAKLGWCFGIRVCTCQCVCVCVCVYVWYNFKICGSAVAIETWGGKGKKKSNFLGGLFNVYSVIPFSINAFFFSLSVTETWLHCLVYWTGSLAAVTGIGVTMQCFFICSLDYINIEWMSSGFSLVWFPQSGLTGWKLLF